MYLPILSTLSSIAPYQFPNASGPGALLPRGTAGPSAGAGSLMCATPGALACNGPKQFGLCPSSGSIQWQNVADGVICACTADGGCRIVVGSDGGLEAPRSGYMPSSVPIATSAPEVPSSIRPISIKPIPTGRSSLTTSSSVAVESSTAAASSSAPPAYSSASPSGSPSSGSFTVQPQGGPGYTFFSGTGSTADGWPSQDDWLTFDQLWEANHGLLKTGCAGLDAPNNTPEDIENIRKALVAESKIANIPDNFALAVMLQESLGCARVKTTSYSVSNPGLFQSHDGTGTCFQSNECPASEITQQVKDGVCGTAAGDGLQQLAQQAGSSGAEKYYRVARLYNSGSLSPTEDLGGSGAATPCYASDIANRLIGWSTGESKCPLS